MSIFIRFSFVLVFLFCSFSSAYTDDLNSDAEINSIDLYLLSQQWDPGTGQEGLLRLIEQWHKTPLVRLEEPASTVNDFILSYSRQASVGEEYRIVPADRNNSTLQSIQLHQVPSGMETIEDLNGIRWIPVEDQAGVHTVEFDLNYDTDTVHVQFLLTVEQKILDRSEVIGVEGGTIDTENVSLMIPANAVDAQVRFNVGRVTGALDPEQKTHLAMISDLVFIDAFDASTGEPIHQFSSDTPLQITIPFRKSLINEEQINRGIVSAFLYDPSLEMLQVPIPTTFDYEAGLATFETTHLSRFDIAYLSVETEDDADREYNTFVDTQTAPLFTVWVHRDSFATNAEASAYSQEVLDGLLRAHAIATAIEFTIPDRHINVYIHEEGDGSGHYSPFSGDLFIDDDLTGTVIHETAAHEYFHAIQDEYYTFTVAGLSGVFWWAEASAVWFETRINTNAAEKYLAVAEGYLRQPLSDSNFSYAYTKSTFIQWAENNYIPRDSENDNFVLEAFLKTDSFLEPTPATYLQERFDLSTNYDDYIRFAMGQYGIGSQSNLAFDGQIFVRNDSNHRVFDTYVTSSQINRTQPNPRVNITPVDDVVSVLYEDQFSRPPFHAHFYSILSNQAESKQIRLKYNQPSIRGIELPFIEPMVFLLDTQGTRSEVDASLITREEIVIHDFGTGPDDQVSGIWLVDTDLYDEAIDLRDITVPNGSWEITIQDQPEEIDGIPFAIPSQHEERHEFRVYNQGEFDFPTLVTDLSRDTDSPEYSLSFLALERFSIPGFGEQVLIAPAWFASGIDAQSNTITYGDSTVGVSNSVRDQSLPARTLADFPAFLVQANGTSVNDFGNGTFSFSIRGELSVHYVDGPITFTTTVSPDVIVAGETPVTITVSVTNQSSLPFIVNGLELELAPGEFIFDPIREGTSSPLLTVPPMDSGQATLTNVIIQPESIPASLLDTQLNARLVIQDNGENLNPADLNTLIMANFWNSARSEATPLMISNP